MNQDLLQLLQDYATQGHDQVHQNLLGKSKDNLIAMLTDLLTTYFNDRNSSTPREIVVAVLSGYLPNAEKIGYNGYRQNTLTGVTEHCEIKPMNIRTDSTAKSPPKLNGGGNFTDYTWARLEKDKTENPAMLIAGFIDGCLIYVFEFSFNEPDFTGELDRQLKQQFPDGDVAGRFLRSASFTFKHFAKAKSLKVKHVASQEELQAVKAHITRKVFKYLVPTRQKLADVSQEILDVQESHCDRT